jgi:hypothetical protein
MSLDTLKNDLQVLAEAQTAFELNDWKRVSSIQREQESNSQAWGVVYEKEGKQFYLNIFSASKAIQMLRRAF